MEHLRASTDIKGAYLQSELDSDAILPSRPSPTSAPTVVGATDPGSDTGTTATEADRVCSAKDTREMADGLQIAETNATGAHALLMYHATAVHDHCTCT